jgi:hypothetical protein
VGQAQEGACMSINGMKQTKSTPWHGGGVAFAAYAGRSPDSSERHQPGTEG